VQGSVWTPIGAFLPPGSDCIQHRGAKSLVLRHEIFRLLTLVIDAIDLAALADVHHRGLLLDGIHRPAEPLRDSRGRFSTQIGLPDLG
jgi:hypothetical protein